VRPSLPALLLAALLALSAGAAAGEQAGAVGERLARIEEAVSTRNRAAIPVLRGWAGEDPDETVRERATGALAILGDRDSQALLLSLLASDRSPRVRRAAVDGIGYLSLPVSFVHLEKALQKDPSPQVRMEAARAIGKGGKAEAAPALVMALLQDGAPEVRALSAEALARLGFTAASENLAWAAEHDGSTLVRILAVRALRTLGGGPAQAVFESTWKSAKEWDLRFEAFQGLLAGGRANAWVEEGLTDGDDRVRSIALRSWALGQGYLPRETGRRKGREEAVVVPTAEERVPRTSPNVVRLEKYLSDPARGVRETARRSLETMGYHVLTEGLSYRIDSSR
jgi:hypothetical protein